MTEIVLILGIISGLITLGIMFVGFALLVQDPTHNNLEKVLYSMVVIILSILWPISLGIAIGKLVFDL